MVWTRCGVAVHERVCGGDNRFARTAAHRSRRSHPRFLHSFIPDRSRLIFRPEPARTALYRMPHSRSGRQTGARYDILRPKVFPSFTGESLWTLWITSEDEGPAGGTVRPAERVT